MVYSSTINRLNKSLRNKDLIQCMIEQNYVVKKDYVSKWFSVQEVSKEVLDSEMKVTFNNGNILKYETLCYIITGNGSTITSLETIEFKNKECIIIKKQIDGREREFKILTQEEYWGKPKIGVTTFNSYDGQTHHSYYSHEGTILESKVYDNNGKLEERNTYYYNDKKLLYQIISERQGKRYINRYEYDDRGNGTYAEWYDDNGVRKQGITRYNQYNDIVFDDNWWGGKRIKKEFEYSYDEYGNWLKCREMNNGIYTRFSIRQFKYFNR